MENIKVKRHENGKIPTCLLIGVPEMNERKDVEEIFETIMAEIFPDMMKDTKSSYLRTSVSPNENEWKEIHT